jgi:hypothetical protein
VRQRSRSRQELDEIATARRTSVVMEVLGYLRQSRKWWMLPILIAMFCLGVVVLLAGTPVAPFIYTLF